jgi:Mrp family chromosome partitioning ATPase
MGNPLGVGIKHSFRLWQRAAATSTVVGIVTDMSGFLQSSSGTANTIFGDTGAKNSSGAREQHHQFFDPEPCSHKDVDSSEIRRARICQLPLNPLVGSGGATIERRNKQ